MIKVGIKNFQTGKTFFKSLPFPIFRKVKFLQQKVLFSINLNLLLLGILKDREYNSLSCVKSQTAGPSITSSLGDGGKQRSDSVQTMPPRDI